MSAQLAIFGMSLLLGADIAALLYLRVHHNFVFRVLGCIVLIANCVLCFILGDIAQSAVNDGKFVIDIQTARVGPLVSALCLVFLHRGIAEQAARGFWKDLED